MLSRIIAALLLLVSAIALAEPRKLATISNETPTAKQDAAVRHLNEVGRKYNDWLQSFTSTNEVISNAAEWDAAGQKIRFQTRGGAVIEADAKPVGVLSGGRWAWPSQSSPYYSDATKQVRAWLDKNGMSFLTEQDSLDLNPSQIKSMLGLAAELTKQDGFYMILQGNRWVGVVFSNPHPLVPQASQDASSSASNADHQAESSNASAPTVSINLVRKWLGITEPMEISELFEVKLANGEMAFLANVSFPEQGRNIADGVALVRPKISQAKIIEMDTVSQVVDLGDNSASGVISSSYESGQGLSTGSNSFSIIENWKPVILMKTEWKDNTGDCGENSYNKTCESEDVKWSLESTPDEPVLVETISKGSGTDPEHLEMVKTTNRYGLRTGKPVKL